MPSKIFLELHFAHMIQKKKNGNIFSDLSFQVGWQVQRHKYLFTHSILAEHGWLLTSVRVNKENLVDYTNAIKKYTDQME